MENIESQNSPLFGSSPGHMGTSSRVPICCILIFSSLVLGIFMIINYTETGEGKDSEKFL